VSLVPFQPTPVQKEFIFSPHKYTALYGGVGNGKTTAGVMKGHYLSQAFPGNLGLVGRLTYPELRDTTQREFLEVARLLNGGTLEEGQYIKKWSKTEGLLELTNGSAVMFRYLQNYESILSLSLGWWYLDQAEFIPESTYLALESRTRYWSRTKVDKFVKDELDRTGRQPKWLPRFFGFITGNPAPGWVYERWKMNPSKQYFMFEAPTKENASNLPADFEASLRATYPADYVKRYLDGSWDVFVGQVLPEFNQEVHVVPYDVFSQKGCEGVYSPPPAHWARFIGWDHGQDNPTAAIFIAVDEEGNVVVYREYYKSGSILEQHADAVKQLCIGDSVPRSADGAIITHMDPQVAGQSDPVTGRDFRQLYQGHGILGLVANKKVNAGIGRLRQLMHRDPTHKYPKWHPRAGEGDAPRMFILDICPNLLHEIPLYQWEKRREGSLRNEPEKPRKYLDHALDAVRYAVMAWWGDKAEEVRENLQVESYRDMIHREMCKFSLDTNPLPME
jgi:hypothetical protein